MPYGSRSGKRGQATTLAQVLSARHSCRAFLDTRVPRDTIVRIVELAQRTPSWCNAQPWQLVITSGEATERFRHALSDHAAAREPAPDIPFPREYRGLYQERRRTSARQLYESVGVTSRQDAARQAAENFRFFGAPHVALVTTDEALGTYGAIDCGAYVSTFILAAWSLGVASIAQASIASYSRFVREYFGISEDRWLVCGISFGYPDSTHRANAFHTGRAAIDDVVEWVD